MPASDLEPALANKWLDVADDALLGAKCRRLVLGRSVLVLAEPITEGFVAACLARFGEGPVAVAIDGTTIRGPRGPVEPGQRQPGHLRPHRTTPRARAHLPASAG